MQSLSPELLGKQLRRDFPQVQEEDISAAVMRSGGFLGQARELLNAGDALPPQTEGFIHALCNRDSLLLTQTLTPMEKWKRDPLSEIMTDWMQILEEALASRSGIRAISPLARQLSQVRTAPELRDILLILKKAADYTKSNVSPAAVCGWLQWELR